MRNNVIECCAAICLRKDVGWAWGRVYYISESCAEISLHKQFWRESVLHVESCTFVYISALSENIINRIDWQIMLLPIACNLLGASYQRRI